MVGTFDYKCIIKVSPFIKGISVSANALIVSSSIVDTKTEDEDFSLPVHP